MCINIYHKKHIQNFSYTLVHHLNQKKRKLKNFKFLASLALNGRMCRMHCQFTRGSIQSQLGSMSVHTVAMHTFPNPN